MATGSANNVSETPATTTVSIKQELVERDSPPSVVSDPTEAATVAAAAAAAAAVVQRHFRLGLNTSPSVVGRRSALNYSTTSVGSRASRLHSSNQPETCVCEVCQVELGRYEALFCHKLLHFNSGNVCYVCDLYFAGGADELRLHVATHHRDIAGLHPKASDTAFVCPVCVQRFSTSKSLLRHQAQLHSPAIQSISSGRKVSCAICTVDFVTEHELLAHLGGAQHKDMKIKLQSIFICIDCRSIFSNRDAYAFHMMTRAQNETCDILSVAAAATAAEVSVAHTQNGSLTPASSAAYQQLDGLPSPSPHGRINRQNVDGRRGFTDSATRHSRPVSDRHDTARAAAQPQLGTRFDDETVGRRWLAGRVRNGTHARIAGTVASADKRSGTGTSSSSVDVGASGGVHPAPLNLTCGTADRRSSTAASNPTNVVDDVRRRVGNEDGSDWSLRQSWRAAADREPPVDCLSPSNVPQRRSMSARSDSDRRPSKVRRRTCWSVDNIAEDLRSRHVFHSTLAKPAYGDMELHRRERVNLSPTVSSYHQKDMSAWHAAPATSSTEYLDYCNDVASRAMRTPSSARPSSLVGGPTGNVDVAGPDRQLVNSGWARSGHLPGHDGDLRSAGSGGGGGVGAARDCSLLAEDSAAADEDHDDDALRQLLRLIQQPDGQPVFLCRHCDIIYADRMLYALHMGLHNVNNPWQCNICGTTCSGRQQFALHALHY